MKLKKISIPLLSLFFIYVLLNINLNTIVIIVGTIASKSGVIMAGTARLEIIVKGSLIRLLLSLLSSPLILF